MKRLFWVVLALVALGLGLQFFTSVALPRWAQTAHTLPAPAVVELVKGARLADFAKELENNGVIASSLTFRLWVRFAKDYSLFQAGRYRFEGAQSPEQVVETIVGGKTFHPFELQFVIPEGFTLKQVIERLLARGVGTRMEWEALSKDAALRKKYDISGPNVEGYLFPATYSFEVMPSAALVMEKMISTFFQNIPEGLGERLKAKNLDMQKAVTFASLIEKETMFEDEMPMVSEVIWTRLKTGEPLGIDAALIYGIQDYKGDITWKHLRDRDNPFNTRIHKGLPPGPIGAISMQALTAVAEPSALGYRFYVLGNDGSGRHHFTKTLDEHNRYVKQLIRSSQ